MASSRTVVAVVASLHLLSLSSTLAQTLTAVKCNATLRSPRTGFAILYDNDDSVYLFGGHVQATPSPIFKTDVIKYFIRNDTAQVDGQLPYAWGDHSGGALMDTSGNILYLSGRNDGKRVWQYSPELRNFVNVSSFEESNMDFSTIRADNDTVFIIGGLYARKSILSWDLNTLESEEIDQLQEDAVNPAAVWVEEKDAAYIFSEATIQKYSRDSNTTEKLSLELPFEAHSYGLAWDGRFAYLMGNVTDGNPSQSIVKFDPQTEAISFIPVEGLNLPLGNGVGVVYVEKLNRIYTFGGYRRDDGYLDEIYYIDLDPLN